MKKVIFALICALLVPSQAYAACKTTIGKPDSTAFPTVRIPFSQCDQGTSAPDFSVQENGQQIYDVKINNANVATDTHAQLMLAIDVSKSMNGAKFVAAQKAALSLLDQAGEHDEIGLVVFGGAVELVSAPTKDHARLRMEIANLKTTQGTLLYSGVQKAVEAFDENAQKRVLVILSDGSDAGSKISENDALQSAKDAEVQIYSVGIKGVGFSAHALEDFAQKTGGEYQSVTDASQLSAVYTALGQKLLQTYWLEYRSNQGPSKSVAIEVSVNGDSLPSQGYKTPSLKVQQERAQKHTLKPSYDPPPTVDLPKGHAGLLLAALPFGLLVLFMGYAFLNRRLRPNLSKRVDKYTTTPEAKEVKETKERTSMLAPLYQFTESVFGKSNLFSRFNFLIEQAKLPLKAVELLYIILAAGVFGFAFGLMFTHNFFIALIVFAVSSPLPYMWVKFRAKRRKKAFENQLSDVLAMIASSLKAGHSFNHSLAAVVKETPNPTSEEFDRVLMEARLGIPMEEGLQAMATRMGSQDFDFVVTTVNIQRTVGGSLSEILYMVSDTVRNRQQFRKKVKALTSMGTMSAYVLLGMPIFMVGLLSLVNPTYMAPLFNTSMGHKMLGAGIFFMFLGWYACKKVVTIKT